MATINNIKKRASEIKNAYEPESVTAEDVGGLIGDLAEVTEQANGVLEGVVEDVDYGQRRTDLLQETLNSIGAHEGVTQFATDVTIANGTGLLASNVQQAIQELATEIFPVKVTFYESYAGTFEVGEKITPRMVLDIKRNGVNVQSSATVTVSPEVADDITVVNNRKVITDDELTSGSKTYTINVRQGGQDAAPLTASYTFMNYVYGFAVDSKPSNAAAVIAAIVGKQSTTSARSLSASKKKDSTQLAANKYYIFAVPGADVNLVCRHAETNGIISGCTVYKGDTKLSIPRINDTDSDYYSAIIVEKSSSTWNFKITNS